MRCFPDSSPQHLAERASFTRVVVVADPDGLHLRNCLAVVNVVQRHHARVTINGNGQVVDAASILELMSLAAIPGTELIVSATGPKAIEALEDIAQLFVGEPSEACSG